MFNLTREPSKKKTTPGKRVPACNIVHGSSSRSFSACTAAKKTAHGPLQRYALPARSSAAATAAPSAAAELPECTQSQSASWTFPKYLKTSSLLSYPNRQLMALVGTGGFCLANGFSIHSHAKCFQCPRLLLHHGQVSCRHAGLTEAPKATVRQPAYNDDHSLES